MPQISEGLKGKTKNSLSWLFGIASLFVAGKANSQNPMSEHGTAKITTIDSLSKNQIKMPLEIIFPLDSLKMDSIYKKNNFQENIPKSNFDSLEFNISEKIPIDIKIDEIGKDSLPNVSVENIPNDTTAVLSNRKNIRQEYIDSLQSYLKKDPRIENIQEFIRIFSFGDEDKIRIDTVQVRNPYNFVNRAAFFMPTKDSIVIYHHNLEITLGQFRVSGDHRLKGFEYQDLQREIEIANDNIPFVFFHEFIGHRLNRKSYIPFGFTNSQAEQINIADEVSAPLMEMVLCREIYRASGDLELAFRAQRQRGESKIIRDNYFRGAAVYAEFLEKNPNISEIPKQDEIDAMMRAAIGVMNTNVEVYKKDIPVVVENDFSRSKYVLKYKAVPERYVGQSILFDETIKNYFTLYGICFLEACSPQVRNEFMNFVISVKNSKPFRRNMEKVYQIFTPDVFEKMKSDLVRDLELSQSSTLDTDFYEMSVFMTRQKEK